MKHKKIILHLCADIGSDSRPYQLDNNYEVIKIGKNIGVENFTTDKKIHGIIANPVCTEFSTARNFCFKGDLDKGMFLVNECLRIIKETSPRWWVLENPANGRLKELLGKPKYTYQPWEYGTPWTKKTALWGDFIIPKKTVSDYNQVHNKNLYIRKGRKKVGLYQLHKNCLVHIEEFKFAIDYVKTDADLRSLCSQGFAKEFKKLNP